MSAPVYHPRLPRGWWLGHGGYRRYMLRELSCIPIGVFAAMLVLALFRLGQGADAWLAFRAALATPPAIAWQVIALAFAVYHSVSWFTLAPRTMPLVVGDRKVPPAWIAAAHFVLWLALSLAILLIVGA
jgi:fumarate reductase subunit C